MTHLFQFVNLTVFTSKDTRLYGKVEKTLTYKHIKYQ